MKYGQGAAMALPIFAYYMKKVYADKQLGYDENEPFDFDEGYNPCSYNDDVDEFNDIEEVYE
jgi:penicillin-binding protein 1A